MKKIDDTLSGLPLTDYTVKSNTQIYGDVRNERDNVNISNPRATAMSNFSVRNSNQIEETTNMVTRGESTSFSPEQELAKMYGHIGSLNELINVYKEPKSPIMFPQAEDAIKSLNFSAASKDTDVVRNVTAYYQKVIQLLNGDISVDEYYAEMPALIESVKDFTLNETDWETLRDSILRVQRYIVNYMWEDMQRISRAMDDGFSEYQKQLNDWIDTANRYYTSDSFIPGGSLILDHLGRGDGNIDRDNYQLQQNMRYLVDGMCVQTGAQKPSFNLGVDVNIRDKYPTNKQMVWIHELDI